MSRVSGLKVNDNVYGMDDATVSDDTFHMPVGHWTGRNEMYEIIVSDRRFASCRMLSTKTRLVCQMDDAITVSPIV